jgi:hypothetical protein
MDGAWVGHRIRFKELVMHACIKGRTVVLSPYQTVQTNATKSCWGCSVSKQNLLITNTLKKSQTLSESLHIGKDVVVVFSEAFSRDPSIHPFVRSSQHPSMDGIIQGRKPWQK